jgi:hypothetical protein
VSLRPAGPVVLPAIQPFNAAPIEAIARRLALVLAIIQQAALG